MKLLLCMTIVIASFSVGLVLYSRLHERIKVLSQHITLLEEVAVRMTYTSSNLAALFAENFAGFIFSDTEPFAQQFKKMIRRYRDVLNTEDIRILDDFSEDLGASDTDSQLRHIQLYVSLLNNRLDEAREEEKRKGKLTLVLPLSIGIAAAILLL